MKTSVLRVQLHTVILHSLLVYGLLQVGLRLKLLMQGVAMILRTNLACERVFANPEVKLLLPTHVC